MDRKTIIITLWIVAVLMIFLEPWLSFKMQLVAAGNPKNFHFFDTHIIVLLMSIGISLMIKLVFSVFFSSLMALIKTKRNYLQRLFLYVPIWMIIIAFLMGIINYRKYVKGTDCHEIEYIELKNTQNV